ncbi:unnamed protein product [Clavelina lepadiformis]|uniref:HTH cro/C1-type domain-containing protein n=1 Tax=Clavelina lepadiformis TaxID=159417 RepID=A0ABP0FBG8_CLALP
MTWSAVCSVTPHSHPDEGASPHLCIFERKRLTTVRRRLSLTQAGLARDIPDGFGSASAMKSQSLESLLSRWWSLEWGMEKMFRVQRAASERNHGSFAA